MKNLIKRNLCGIVLSGCAALLFTGCFANKENVLAVTGTVIGVQIHQKDADKTPELKVGYARTEFAFVPTDKGTNGGSAANSAEVLMEIHAEGSVGLGTTYQGGIYQRLAVGKTAVQQPGAAFMMAKDSGGSMDPATATAVQKATSTVKSVPVPPIKITAEKAKMFTAFTAAPANQDKFEAAAEAAGYPTTGGLDHPAFRNFVSEVGTPSESFTAVSDSLKANGLTW